MNTVPTNDEQLRTEVQKRYAKTALQVLGTEQASTADACCETSCCTPGATADDNTKTIVHVIQPSSHRRQPVVSQVVAAPGRAAS